MVQPCATSDQMVNRKLAATSWPASNIETPLELTAPSTALVSSGPAMGSTSSSSFEMFQPNSSVSRGRRCSKPNHHDVQSTVAAAHKMTTLSNQTVSSWQHPVTSKVYLLLLSLVLVIQLNGIDVNAGPVRCYSLCTRSENDVMCRKCRFREPMRFGKRLAPRSDDEVFSPHDTMTSHYQKALSAIQPSTNFDQPDTMPLGTPLNERMPGQLPAADDHDSWRLLARGLAEDERQQKRSEMLTSREDSSKELTDMLQTLHRLFESEGVRAAGRRQLPIRGLRWG